MIVVAIIGILAAVAIPQYNNYVSKTKWRAAYAESASARSDIEIALSSGNSVALADIRVFAITSHCANTISGSAGNGIVFVCTVLGGPPGVAGSTISQSRAASGGWTCESSAKQSYIGDLSLCTGN